MHLAMDRVVLGVEITGRRNGVEMQNPAHSLHTVGLQTLDLSRHTSAKKLKSEV